MTEYTPTTPFVPVTLLSHQVKTYEKEVQHTIYHTFRFDTSPTGSGKTPTNIKLAQDFDMLLVVAGPANIEGNWVNEAVVKYGCRLIFLSYTKLSRLEVDGHPYVISVNEEYQTTPLFQELLNKQKVYFIMDESQGTKNDDSKTSRACAAICTTIRRTNNGSRVVMLSATPFSKEEEVESCYKMMGVMTAKDLFHYNLGYRTYTVEGYGYKQIVDYCRRIDPVATAAIELEEYDYSARDIRECVFKLWIEVVKPKYSFAMPKPIIKGKFIPMEMHYKTSPEELAVITAAVNGMKKTANYDDGNQEIVGSMKMGAITKAFEKVEVSKVNVFARAAIEVLEKHPNNKVVIFVWHDETTVALLKILEKYNPLRCDGKVAPKKREVHQGLFQAHNNQYRLIIAKPTSFGVGINLDDTNGEYPRHFFISPYYNFEKTHQAAGRGYRATTLSDMHCTLVYVKGAEESGILGAINRKKNVTKNVVTENEDNGDNKIVYPGEYPIVIQE